MTFCWGIWNFLSPFNYCLVSEDPKIHKQGTTRYY